MSKQSEHGGAFFAAIGDDFSTLERSSKVISADVLDAWFDPSPKVIKKVREYLSFALKTSPPTHCEGLIRIISKQREIPQENIVVGSGSSSLIFSFFPHILNKGDKVMILDPMYSEYPHILEDVIGATVYRHVLNKKFDFAIDCDLLVKDITKIHPTVMVLVNPNNPTGQYLGKEDVLELAKTFSDVIFVVDEAYIDYVERDKSVEREVVKHPNLVVIKSMSKVYGLSGVRLAYLTAPVSIIEKISQFIPPWPVSLVAQIAGVEALKDKEYYTQKYAETKVLREAMIQDLLIPSLRIFDSVANFFLVNLTGTGLSARNIVEELREQNIYLRNCDSISKQFHDDFIRIAVKDKTSNKIITSALKALL
ncbi:MAG: histidinol-phosphate transaminase [bacterium]|nr:histidinol-phosphate transaminase [bacterium]